VGKREKSHNVKSNERLGRMASEIISNTSSTAGAQFCDRVFDRYPASESVYNENNIIYYRETKTFVIIYGGFYKHAVCSKQVYFFS